MKFNELETLPRIKGEDCLDTAALKALLPNTPDDVIEQFYSDHGLNPDFQEQYQGLDTSLLKWELVQLSASELISASVYDEFQQYFQTCTDKSRRVGTSENWHLLHNLECVYSYWEENKTWVRPPVLLKSGTLNDQQHLHLIEGHSRLGALKGLVLGKTLQECTSHSVWLGGYESAA